VFCGDSSASAHGYGGVWRTVDGGSQSLKIFEVHSGTILNSAFATVCANPSLKNVFEATVNFLSEFIEEQNQAELQNISSGQSGHE
jgi:hypothetical protein